MIEYDDFLALLHQDLSDVRLIAFCGKSGSGKSTAIQFLFENHPDFAGIHPFIIQSHRTGWRCRSRMLLAGTFFVRESLARDCWVVVDEIVSLADVLGVAGLLMRGKRVVMASHVPPTCLQPLCILGKYKMFRTDHGAAKLARYLKKQRVVFSQGVLDRFVKKYGATYTDLDIILERTREPNFDQAFARFERLCSIA